MPTSEFIYLLAIRLRRYVARTFMISFGFALKVRLSITVGMREGLHARNGVAGTSGTRMNEKIAFRVYTSVTAMSRCAD